MPKVIESTESAPESLRPYLFHGVELGWKDGSKEAIGDCPFCGRENKFSVVIQTGQWRCLVCNEGEDKGKAIKGGNAHVFIRKLWEYSDKATKDHSELVKNRGYLDALCLVHWEVVKSVTTGNWLIPGYGADGHMNQLYKYMRSPIPTPTLGHQLHGVNLYDAAKPIVYLCEGPWDGIALWEILGQAKETDNGLSPTGNPAHSLLSSANVLAVPGCGTFLESWLPLFAGKIVNLMFDNDHWKENPKTGAKIPPGGLGGMQRNAKILSESSEPPEAINFLRWGKDDHVDLSLESGVDVRDFLNGDV